MIYANIFIDSNIAKVLDCINQSKQDINTIKICELTKLTRKTVDKAINHLLSINMIYVFRKIGKTKMLKKVKTK